MRKYSELGTVHRNEPCLEYPGCWIVYASGNEVDACHSFETAYSVASQHVETSTVLGEEVSICWNCSENDPRAGEVWFTGFYQHGKFDFFGRYVS